MADMVTANTGGKGNSRGGENDEYDNSDEDDEHDYNRVPKSSPNSTPLYIMIHHIPFLSWPLSWFLLAFCHLWLCSASTQ